jgi:hypothetical protein
MAAMIDIDFRRYRHAMQESESLAPGAGCVAGVGGSQNLIVHSTYDRHEQRGSCTLGGTLGVLCGTIPSSLEKMGVYASEEPLGYRDDLCLRTLWMRQI